MENQNLLSRIKTIFVIASRYCGQHSASLAAMQKVYAMQWPGDTANEGHTLVVIRISPFGSLYEVSQCYYLKGELQRENSWIASYGWHSNGHLMEIGGYRYCILDPVQKQLYLEWHNDDIADKSFEVYAEI